MPSLVIDDCSICLDTVVNKYAHFQPVIASIIPKKKTIHTIGDEVSFSVIGFLEIVLHAFAQNNDLVRIFHSVLFALVDKFRAKS